MNKNNDKLFDPMEYVKYDKICDDIYTLGHNCVLRFTVSLSRNINNTRQHFHKEFEYNSKYENVGSLVTVKRSYDYFLSIENTSKPENTDKCFIRIGPQEYYLFKQAVDTAVSWFISEKYEKLFTVSNGKLAVSAPIPDHTVSSLPMNKFLKFIPAVIQRGPTIDEMEPGVTLFLSDMNNAVNMNLDRLMGLKYLISNFNMVTSAQIMLNYISPPEYGFNRFVMEGASNNAYGKPSAPAHMYNQSMFEENDDGLTVGGMNGRRMSGDKKPMLE